MFKFLANFSACCFPMSLKVGSKEIFFLSQPEVNFLVADENEPLGIFLIKLINFLIFTV
jgi:hypothetical protein